MHSQALTLGSKFTELARSDDGPLIARFVDQHYSFLPPVLGHMVKQEGEAHVRRLIENMYRVIEDDINSPKAQRLATANVLLQGRFMLFRVILELNQPKYRSLVHDVYNSIQQDDFSLWRKWSARFRLWLNPVHEL